MRLQGPGPFEEFGRMQGGEQSALPPTRRAGVRRGDGRAQGGARCQ